MRRMVAGALFTIGTCTVASAGQLYGTLRQNDQPVQSAPVSVTCGSERKGGQTDSEGVYRVLVSATGNCTLVLEPDGRRAQGTLYSYDRPTGYDFDVVNQHGSWVLVPRRR
jgi:hypothetical protein